jgi:hypothetical protein
MIIQGEKALEIRKLYLQLLQEPPPVAIKCWNPAVPLDRAETTSRWVFSVFKGAVCAASIIGMGVVNDAQCNQYDSRI